MDGKHSRIRIDLRKHLQKHSATFLLALIIAIGVWYLFTLIDLARLTRFIADDYCSYNSAASLGWLRFMWFWFITWGGRLSAISADMLLLWLGQNVIGYVAYFAVVVWVVVNYKIIHHFLKEEQGRTERFFISISGALIFVYAVTRAFPNFIQTLFWFSAFRTHTLPVILFNIWILLAIRTGYAKRSITAKLLALFVFACFNAAFSEVFTTLQITVLGGVLLLRLLTAPKQWGALGNKIIFVGLLGGVIGLALMFFAPGTVDREALLVGERTISAVMRVSFESGLVFYRAVLKDPYRAMGLVSALLFSFAVAPASREFKHPRLSSGWMIAILIVISPLLVFISFLPGAYGMGESIPRRAFSIPIFFSFIPLIGAALIAGQNIAQDRQDRTSTIVLSAAVLLLVGSWVGNARSIANDQSRMRAYAEAIGELEINIEHAIASGDSELVIPQLGNWAGVYDPSDNPKFWVTQCFSEYYQIEIIGPKIK